MGASSSRIWTNICSIESEDVRAHMIERVLTSPEYVAAAQAAGVYTTTVNWLATHRRGHAVRFPYATGLERDTIQHTGSDARWSMYTTPVPPQRQQQQAPRSQPQSALIVSPAAKALDYFQEALEMLGIEDSETLTAERLRAGYKKASLRAHPDKGGSKEAFDEVRRAYQYVERILERISPNLTSEQKTRMTTAVTLESATAQRAPMVADAPPVQLSAKKLDMSTFNRLFEENRLPDPTRDAGYGDWLKSTGGGDEISADARLKGKFNQQLFEQVFTEKALKQTSSTAVARRLEPDAMMSCGGTELGGETTSFTAAMGSETQFTDLKEAYTSGATMYHEVADVQVSRKGARSIEEAKRQREADMSRVDPDEASRIAAAAMALEEREKQRRLRAAQQDMAAEAWSNQMRRRLMVNNG
jgi:curved DNA-binding protein CbpA